MIPPPAAAAWRLAAPDLADGQGCSAKPVPTENLKHDRQGNERTAYSLRHTYISMRLMEGADIYQVAKNCRTSVEMIEKHYATHIRDVIDTRAVNVRKDRRPEPVRKAQRKKVVAPEP